MQSNGWQEYLSVSFDERFQNDVRIFLHQAVGAQGKAENQSINKKKQ